MKTRHDAPPGHIPKRGEAWLPVGRHAGVGAFFLVDPQKVRAMVPEELEIVEVLPGRTVASFFLGDYGPGSTLEFHELGIQPALVRCHTGIAMWSARVLVDSEASYVGGMPLGFTKEMATFDWEEERASGGRASGRCAISQGGEVVIRVDYAQGLLPLPSVPSRVATLKDDALFSSFHHLRGRYRLSRVTLDVPEDSPHSILRTFGKPLAGVVITDLRGRMGDDVVASFMPNRSPRASLEDHERDDRPPPPSTTPRRRGSAVQAS